VRPVVNLASEPSPPVVGSLSFRVSEPVDCLFVQIVTFPSSFGLLAGPLLDGSFGLLSNVAFFQFIDSIMLFCYLLDVRLLLQIYKIIAPYMNFS